MLRSQTVTRKSLLSEWTPTDCEQLRKFFGIIICMGLVKMPEIKCYWSKKQIYSYKFVKINITRNRFSILLRMLHFNDNETFEQHRRLHKIEPLIDMLTENFRSVYTAGEKVVVDESLVPFRGRVIFQQYIPGKSHKYDIKLYKLCSTRGYTWKMQVYTGSLVNVPEYNHSESIVLKLAKPLLKKSATNFYSSLPLAGKLL